MRRTAAAQSTTQPTGRRLIARQSLEATDLEADLSWLDFNFTRSFGAC